MTPPKSPITNEQLERAQTEAEAGRGDELNKIAAECAGWEYDSHFAFDHHWHTKSGRVIRIGDGEEDFCHSLDSISRHLEKSLIEKGCHLTVFADAKDYRAEWYFNGYWIGDGGATTEPIARLMASVKAHIAMKE